MHQLFALHGNDVLSVMLEEYHHSFLSFGFSESGAWLHGWDQLKDEVLKSVIASFGHDR